MGDHFFIFFHPILLVKAMALNVTLPLDRPRSDGQEETRRVVFSASIPFANCSADFDTAQVVDSTPFVPFSINFESLPNSLLE